MFVCIPFAWLLALVLIDASTSNTYLHNQAVAAPSILVAFLLFEFRGVTLCSLQSLAATAATDVPEHLRREGETEPQAASCCAAAFRLAGRRLLRWGSAAAGDDGVTSAFPGTPREPEESGDAGAVHWNVQVSALVLHLLTAGYAAWRLSTCLPAELGFEVVHCVLLYCVLLLLTLLRWRESRGLPERLRALEAEVGEARVQYEAMCGLLQRKGYDDDDNISDDEGDDREHLIVPPKAAVVPEAARGNPLRVLPLALNGHRFDREVAMKICKRIRKHNYTLAMYYDDVRAAFPELSLYLACREGTMASPHDDSAGLAGKPAVTSGLSSDDEYRRTIGALFAVYWLMRIGVDGERGFSFGVDDKWVPHEVPAVDDGKSTKPPPTERSSTRQAKGSAGKGGGALSEVSMTPPPVLRDAAKRLAFYDSQDWSRLQQLLIDSGMLEGERGDGGALRVNVERTMAMLALTAFHDIMKVEALLPAVAPEHAPYLGFKQGDVINDHDIALGYVLDYNAQLLPSFSAMREHDQKTIRFTQSKMAFNHGWLVQGEAPPAPLFAKFKEVMMTEGVNPSDVAFYFVHWLTDLAGAEPSPLGGAEKFVLKFPHAVLDSFIRSFAVLNELAVKSETAVMEEYLVRTWSEVAGRGPPPTSEDGVALMRLTLQAQTPDKQQAVLEAWASLPKEDAAVLREEMARTGIQNQMFSAAPNFKNTAGPAFLVYYSPAFIRTLAPANAFEALRVLAEVYRRARGLWPLTKTTGNAHHVTIRIDQIKELKIPEIQTAFAQGESWLLCRKNDNEAVIERHTLESMQEQTSKGIPNSVLKFWRLERDAGSRGSRGSNRSKMTSRSKRSKEEGSAKGVTFSAPSESNCSAGASEPGNGSQPVPAEELQRKMAVLSSGSGA